MIEASLLYPMIVLISIALLALMVSVYFEAETQSRLHIYTRAYAAKASGCSENKALSETLSEEGVIVHNDIIIQKGERHGDKNTAVGRTILSENNRYVISGKEYAVTEKLMREMDYVMIFEAMENNYEEN